MNLIVNTPLVRVMKSKKGLEMHITCKDGAVVEHEPFKDDLEGLVAALSLCAEICAGKFYIAKVLSVPKIEKVVMIPQRGDV